jgi:iron complex transport system substrate-binding protein
MKRLLIFNSLFLIISCSNNSNSTTELLNDYNTVNLELAQGFSIKQNKDGFVLSVSNTFKGNNNYNTYNLSRNNSLNKPNCIKIPVTKVICLSATHIGFIDVLNNLDKVKGISGKHYLYNATVLEKVKNKEIIDIGAEGNFDYEKILSLKPDVIFVFGIDQKSLTYINKLQNLGINTILIGEYMENTPLGKTEWIKFFSCFFDSLESGTSYFNKISASYNNLKDSIKNIKITKPTIINGLPYNGIWYVPGGNSFMANFMKDAGADYSWVKNNETAGTPFSLEKIYENAENFDFWLNPDLATSLNQLKKIEPRATLFKAFNNKNVYTNTKKTTPEGGNDYWETGTVHPEIILNDLIHIFHNNSNDSLFYFKKLH